MPRKLEETKRRLTFLGTNKQKSLFKIELVL